MGRLRRAIKVDIIVVELLSLEVLQELSIDW